MKFIALIFTALLMIGTEARAQFHTGPIASATGGAGRAAVDPGEVGFLNPAALAHLTRYYAGANLATSSHAVEGEYFQYGALLADNSPGNLVAGSFSYQRRQTDIEDFPSFVHQDLQISLAGFVYPKVALGVAAHRLYYQPDRSDDHVQDNVHVGLMYTPTNYLGLAFTAHDVLPTKKDVPESVRLVPTLAIGTHFIFQENFRLRLDLVRPDKANPDRRINVLAGLESYFRDDFAFRLGGRWKETANQMWVTTGIGFKGPRLSFDYTFEKDVRQAEGSRHLFDLWLPF